MKNINVSAECSCNVQ